MTQQHKTWQRRSHVFTQEMEQRMKDLRAAGLSQEKTAQILGVDRNTVGYHENPASYAKYMTAVKKYYAKHRERLIAQMRQYQLRRAQQSIPRVPNPS